MQPLAALALILAGLTASPAAACSLALQTGGVLALSANSTRLASDVAGGLPATFTIANLTLGSVMVTVSAPQLTAYPQGFAAGGAQLAVAYSGVGLLGSVTQPFRTTASSFQVPGLLSLAVVMTLHNAVTSPAGFRAGTYSTRTTITCS